MSLLKVLFVVVFSLLLSFEAHANWFCVEASSVREGEYITACGIGESKKEDDARKQATENAFKELDLICNRSADCKDFLVNIEPLRNECQKQGQAYKCYRAIKAEITTKKKTKASEANQKEDKNKTENPDKKFLSTSDLKKLIVELSRLDKVKVERVSDWRCDYNTDDLFKQIYQSTGKGNFENVIKQATLVPFEGRCIRFHSKVINHLERTKSRSSSYESFLKSVLSTSSDDSKGQTSMIIRYFWALGPYPDKLFKLVESVFSRFEPRGMYRVVSFLFHSTPNDSANTKRQKTRLKQVMAKGMRGEYGFPTKASPEAFGKVIFRGLFSSDSLKNPWLAFHGVDTYLEKVEIVRVKDYFRNLKKLLDLDLEKAQKNRVVDLMGMILSKEGLTDSPQDVLTSFVRDIDKKVERLDPVIDEEKAQIDALTQLKSKFIKVNAKNFDRHFSQSKRKHMKDRYIHFCLDQGISCPKTIPSDDSLIKRLSSKKKKTVEDALKIIAKKQSLTRSKKNEIFACMQRFSKRPNYSRNVVREAIHAFVMAGIKDEKIIDEMLKQAWDRVYNYEELAKGLKGNILPSLMKVAFDKRHKNQLVAIRMLGSLGKDAKPAVAKLEKMAKEKNNYSIKNAAQKSIEQIRSAN